MIDLAQQSFIAASIGGLLIGVSSTALLLTYGRITGISGIVGGLLNPGDPGKIWKASFLLGLTLPVYACMFGFYRSVLGLDIIVESSKLTTTGALLAGALVGVGTRLGSGCTSGHGVCGLPRLSKRSFVAVSTFMTVGALVSTFTANSTWARHSGVPDQAIMMTPNIPSTTLGIATVLCGLCYLYPRISDKKQAADSAISMSCGFVFGTGLLISGMWRPSKVLGFLNISKSWDPALMFVMGGAVTLNFFTFNYILSRLKGPLCCPAKDKENSKQKHCCGFKCFSLSSKTNIDWPLVLGSAIFGAGFGLGGACPGPAMLQATAGDPAIVFYFLPAMLGGMIVGQKLSSKC